MKKLLLSLLTSSSLFLHGQITIDTIALVSVERSDAAFCFNNSRLMAGNSVSDRFLVYYNSDTIFLNVNQAGTWTKNVAYLGDSIQSATLALHQDTIWLCWTERPFIKTRYSSNWGQSWSGVMQVSSAGNVAAPSICASSNGKIHFTWNVSTTTDTMVMHRAYAHGAPATDEDTLSTPGFTATWSSVNAVGDTVLCAWKEQHFPTKVYFSKSFDGGQTWDAPSHTSGPPTSKDPNLDYAYDSVSATHYVFLAYDGNNKIYLQRSTNFGSSWTAPDVISNPSKLSQFAHVVANNSGFVGVAYEHRTSQNLFDDTSKDVGFVFSTAWGASGSFGNDSLAYTRDAMGAVFPALNEIDEDNFYLAWITKNTTTHRNLINERRVQFHHPATGISGAENQTADIKIYPNPVYGKFFITFPAIFNSTITVHILNSLGQVVFTAESNFIAGNNILQVQPELKPGIYFVMISDQTHSLVSKLVVVNNPDNMKR